VVFVFVVDTDDDGAHGPFTFEFQVDPAPLYDTAALAIARKH
jgi:hypothetical protein